MAQDSQTNAPNDPQATAPASAPGAKPAGAAQQTQPQHAHQPHPHQAHPHYSAAKFPPAELIETLNDGTKVKRRVLRMRACDEKDEKGEICSGHLKRWFGASRDMIQKHGSELYVCERCRTIYLPNLQEKPRSSTLAW